MRLSSWNNGEDWHLLMRGRETSSSINGECMWRVLGHKGYWMDNAGNGVSGKGNNVSLGRGAEDQREQLRRKNERGCRVCHEQYVACRKYGMICPRLQVTVLLHRTCR